MWFSKVLLQTVVLCVCHVVMVPVVMVVISSSSAAASDNNSKHDNLNNKQSRQGVLSENGGFPTYIPDRDKIRRDLHGKKVEFGRLNLLGGVSAFTLQQTDAATARWNNDTSQQVSYETFKKTLQCAPTEPGLKHHGTLSLLRDLHRVSNTMIEATAAMVESEDQCVEKTWNTVVWDNCLRFAKGIKSGEISDETRKRTRKTNIRLIRVINGRLYYDWPFKPAQKLDKYYQFPTLRLLGGALEKINDIPDSVFLLVSFDLPFLPSNYPFPAINNGPRIDSSELPFPWDQSVNDEIRHYLIHHANRNGNNVDKKLASKDFYDMHGSYNDFPVNLDPDDDVLWSKREEKAFHIGTFWFTSISKSRQIVQDLADKRPDLIVSKWTNSMTGVIEYHPYSPVNGTINEEALKSSRSSSKLREKIEPAEFMAKYKYLVVLAGVSAGERLTTYLAHSGAVVLLQETDVVYHYSSRLKPFVHYVPLAYNGADLIEKIEWLKTHDKLARQIAKNGYAFGKSYLRLEDLYCYAAAVLNEFGNNVAKPEALVPVAPQRIFDELN